MKLIKLLIRNWKAEVKRGRVWKSSPTVPEVPAEPWPALTRWPQAPSGGISHYNDCQGPVGASEERGLSDLQTHTTYKGHVTKQRAGSWVESVWESKQSSDLRQMGQAGAS